MSCWIQTFSRGRVHPMSPALGELRMLDVAHALANICRFGGHTRVFYSVAEHSVRVAEILPPELKLWGLLHDAAEAYVGDMSRPLKSEWPAFVEMEIELLELILAAHGLKSRGPVLPERVQVADNKLLATEFRDLFDGGAEKDVLDGYLETPLPGTIEPWPAERAKQFWLLEYSRLGFDVLDANRQPLSLADLVERRKAA